MVNRLTDAFTVGDQVRLNADGMRQFPARARKNVAATVLEVIPPLMIRVSWPDIKARHVYNAMFFIPDAGKEGR